MTAVRILLLAALFAAGGCFKPKLDPLPPDGVILAFGDSLTYGHGAPESESYPARLRELTGRTVLNYGVNGETTDQGLRRLPRVLDETEPDLLLLCHGGNDFLGKRPETETYENLRAMIRAARDRNVQVVLIGVPRPGLLLRTDDVYKQVAEIDQVPLETKALPAILGKGSLKADMIHPNARGYRELAERVHEFLKSRDAL